jgi:hypothetical protein
VLEILKNIIGSRAENHLIFKGALMHDCKSFVCAPAEGNAQQGD